MIVLITSVVGLMLLLCSTLLLVALHIFCYAFNVYAWAKTRVNYPFIFGFSPGTELRYREVLLLATGLSTFLLAGMNLHIAVTLLTTDHWDPENPPTQTPQMISDIIPLILVVVSRTRFDLESIINRGTMIIIVPSLKGLGFRFWGSSFRVCLTDLQILCRVIEFQLRDLIWRSSYASPGYRN